MVTDMHYYAHYLPYKIGVNGEEAKKLTQVKSDLIVLLNKAYKTEILDYTKSICSSFNGLIISSHRTFIDMESMLEQRDRTSLDFYKYKTNSNLRVLGLVINEALDFFQTQTKSRELIYFKEQIIDFYSEFRENFKSLGLKAQSGRLIYEEDVINKATTNGFFALLSENIDTISEFSKLVMKYTKKPLTVHMNFKELACYYNYEFALASSTSANTFKIIDCGEMVNMSV